MLAYSLESNLISTMLYSKNLFLNTRHQFSINEIMFYLPKILKTQRNLGKKTSSSENWLSCPCFVHFAFNIFLIFPWRLKPQFKNFIITYILPLSNFSLPRHFKNQVIVYIWIEFLPMYFKISCKILLV